MSVRCPPRGLDAPTVDAVPFAAPCVAAAAVAASVGAGAGATPRRADASLPAVCSRPFGPPLNDVPPIPTPTADPSPFEVAPLARALPDLRRVFFFGEESGDICMGGGDVSVARGWRNDYL